MLCLYLQKKLEINKVKSYKDSVFQISHSFHFLSFRYTHWYRLVLEPSRTHVIAQKVLGVEHYFNSKTIPKTLLYSLYSQFLLRYDIRKRCQKHQVIPIQEILLVIQKNA